MQKRPHIINNEQIFAKRALSRFNASIPERLVVTNRLVLSNINKFDKQMVRNYFHKFGRIRKFDYENGLIDFDVTRKQKNLIIQLIFSLLSHLGL